MAKTLLPLIPPGEVLQEEFLRPFGISQNRLARDLGVPPARVNDIIHGRRSITADTATRLAVYFGTSVELWINLQAQYDARVAQRELRPEIERQVEPYAA